MTLNCMSYPTKFQIIVILDASKGSLQVQNSTDSGSYALARGESVMLHMRSRHFKIILKNPEL